MHNWRGFPRFFRLWPAKTKRTIHYHLRLILRFADALHQKGNAALQIHQSFV